MRQVAYKSHEFMKSTPVFQPIMDYFQQEALHLVERWVHPAFHDLDKPDNIIPDFKWIPGSVEYMQIPVEYGELVWYVPPISTSRFVYTESWVLYETWKPLFELDKKLRESFNHTSSGYLWNDLFLVFHNSWNYMSSSTFFIHLILSFFVLWIPVFLHTFLWIISAYLGELYAIALYYSRKFVGVLPIWELPYIRIPSSLRVQAWVSHNRILVLSFAKEITYCS